ncbi:DUF2971 domain-containing protein [Pseudomonas sp. SWRI102]|uniref:DUF2971 domain-containing protein n=1 Tax=Pseudomonas marvdashtae TaxID=2745500 RepID=A0A923JQJ0_9PSED|nr:DUF2971 domain-containing protein [Pseudomonas marvdashtae]MBV4552331.1 DUF2971 domain-containing protein [Pseudomonas marvdashtae]
MYRYKYVPDGEGLLKLLTDRTVKFTHPSKFNDPFDCLPSMPRTKLAALKSVNPVLYERLGLNAMKGVEKVNELYKIEKRLESRSRSGELLSDLLKDASVLSLSKIPDSILMWSHYADFHTGAVVEFKIPTNVWPDERMRFDHGDLIALDVVYSKERPIFKHDGSKSDPNTILNTLYLTKAKQWEYEQESRVIKNDGGEGIFPFRPYLLNGLILGAKNRRGAFFDKLLRKISAEIGKNVSLYQAEFCKAQYKIKIPRFKFKVDELP